MEESKNKNVVVLTVIAIATVLVVVVGATFAYLASQIQTEGSAGINASVEDVESDFLMINAGNSVSLNAYYRDNGTSVETNFGDSTNTELCNTSGNYCTNITQTISSNILLQTGPAEKTYYYDIYLNVDTNNFEYTTGKCYNKSEKDTELTTYQTCVAQGKVWAKASGDAGYSCYNTADEITSSLYSGNSIACLSNSNYMWGQVDVAELALDIYKGTASTSAECVTTNGICVNNKREKLQNITTEDACDNNSGVWLTNFYDDGICYAWYYSQDITKVTAAETKLKEHESISAAANSTSGAYYKSIVSLINLDQNQVENGDNEFAGFLTFKVTNN